MAAQENHVDIVKFLLANGALPSVATEVDNNTLRFSLTHFAQSSKMGTVIKGLDARLVNRPFLVFDFRALWRSALSARVPESQKLKTVGYAAWHRIPELLLLFWESAFVPRLPGSSNRELLGGDNWTRF